MTNLEALKYLIGKSGDVSDATLTTALQFAGIDPDVTYGDTDKCAVYKTAIGEINRNIASGVKRISQGDYTIEYDVNAAKSKIQWLADASGCPELIDQVSDKQPTIVNRTNLW